jgi:hypothetical protein
MRLLNKKTQTMHRRNVPVHQADLTQPLVLDTIPPGGTLDAPVLRESLSCGGGVVAVLVRVIRRQCDARDIVATSEGRTIASHLR